MAVGGGASNGRRNARLSVCAGGCRTGGGVSPQESIQTTARADGIVHPSIDILAAPVSKRHVRARSARGTSPLLWNANDGPPVDPRHDTTAAPFDRPDRM